VLFPSTHSVQRLRDEAVRRARQDARRLREGRRVLLRGLCGDLCSLNGRTGVLQEQLGEGPLEVAEGESVLICGLRRRAELNGQRVRIGRRVTVRGRYEAVLDSGEEVSLRRANLSSLQWCVELEPLGEARGEEPAQLVSLSAANLVATAVQPHGRVVLRANAAQPVAEGQPLPPAMSQEGRRGWRWCGVAASRLAGGWWRVRLEGGVGDVRVQERHLWAAPPRLLRMMETAVPMSCLRGCGCCLWLICGTHSAGGGQRRAKTLRSENRVTCTTLNGSTARGQPRASAPAITMPLNQLLTRLKFRYGTTVGQ